MRRCRRRSATPAGVGVTSSGCARRDPSWPADPGRIRARRVYGREDGPFDLPKMREKHLSFAQVSDIFGFRLVVATLPECYLALGVLHQLYKPVPKGASRTTSRSRRPTATSRCTPPWSARWAPRSSSRSAPPRCTRWPRPASPRTGCTRPAGSEAPDTRPDTSIWARCGCSRWSTSRARRVIQAEFLEHVKIDLFPSRSMSSRRSPRSCAAAAAPRRWTSPMRSTRAWAITAWPRASTASRWRCAPRCPRAIRSRSSPRPRPGPIRPG